MIPLNLCLSSHILINAHSVHRDHYGKQKFNHTSLTYKENSLIHVGAQMCLHDRTEKNLLLIVHQSSTFPLQFTIINSMSVDQCLYLKKS